MRGDSLFLFFSLSLPLYLTHPLALCISSPPSLSGDAVAGLPGPLSHRLIDIEAVRRRGGGGSGGGGGGCGGGGGGGEVGSGLPCPALPWPD